MGQTDVARAGQAQRAVEPKAAAAKLPVSIDGWGHKTERDEHSTLATQRERHDSVMREPGAVLATAQQDVMPASHHIPNGHSSNDAHEIKQLKDKIKQLESKNADLEKAQQVMHHAVEAVRTLCEERLRNAVLELKLEQLEMGKRVERTYQAEERRQLKGTAQAPFHLIVMTGKSLLSHAFDDQGTNEK
jgi:hypothetical protein